MKTTSRGIENEIDIDYEMSVINQETERLILDKYPVITQLNMARLSLVEVQKVLQGQPADYDIIAEANAMNDYIEECRAEGRAKKEALTN